jgi:hypothetical protein
MSTDLTDFDLSSRVSVPTSSLPIDLGSMLYFLKREERVVRASE